MFIMNGIIYGEEPKKIIKIFKVKVLLDKILLLTFSTGEVHLFDATILKGKIFEPLNDENIFQNAEVDHGIVTWANGEIDCSPEFIYENSYEYFTKLS